jgi:hypothetical protein
VCKNKIAIYNKMATNIIVGYSPTDFFYVKAQEMNIMPDDCGSTTTLSETDCNIDNYSDNSYNCINSALCKNKDTAKLISKLQNTHSGSDQNYLDTNQQYKLTLTNTINLGIGILILLGFIIQNRNLQ